MNQPDFQDFYPKSLIPIGTKDKIALFSLQNLTDDTFQATHWLVALQAKMRFLSDEEYGQWQVYLYPADIEGTYTWDKPYFISKQLKSFEEAIEVSSVLETYGKDDAIISSNIQERLIR
jgi:hypothetical protein